MSDHADKKNGIFPQSLRRVLYVVPLVIGTAGYRMSGANVLDSLYSAIGLYAMSATLDGNNALIEAARWLAPLSTATAVITEIGSLRRRVVCFFQSLSKNSVAVYSDTDETIRDDGEGKILLYPHERFLKHARRHIILFSSDAQSFAFYEKYKTQMADADVYIGLREIEQGLVHSAAGGNVRLVDLSSAAARMFWKEIRLWNVMGSAPETPVHIVIYGDSILAEEMLSSGLLLNLYSLRQQVFYHMVSSAGNFRLKHPGFDTMNRDKILFRARGEESTWEIIRNADYVIVADMPDIADFQVLSANVDADRLYVYARDGREYDAYIGLGERKAHRFGLDSTLLTYQNICEDALLKDAMRLNEEYGKDHPEYATPWTELNRFTQNSNVSAADYNEVFQDNICTHIGSDTPTASELESLEQEFLEQLAELEHIRWCRYHFLNYWKYGVPEETDKNKDEIKRIHRDLVPYKELNQDERKKDMKNVKAAVKKLNRRAGRF